MSDNWVGHTIFEAMIRTSSSIDDVFESSASLAAFHSSSATGVLWATHVPKTSKNRTCSCGGAVMLIFLSEVYSEYVDFV